MASMTISVPDAQVDRVLDAIWRNRHDGQPAPDKPTAVRFVRQCLYDALKSEVLGWEAAEAARAITERADDPLDAQKQ